MKINIVTVCYNDNENLLRTFNSIRKYKKSFHNYFVIDGGSTDSTKETIIDNSDIIDDYLIEKDQGIYDAMNKVLYFDLFDDDYIVWLNAGDELIDWKSINILELQNYDCGFYSILSKTNVTGSMTLKRPIIKTPYNEKNFFPSTQFMHQGFIIKQSVFKELKYNVDIGLQAENLLMSQCIQNYRFLVSELPISIFYLDGISNYKFKKVHKSYLKVAKHLGFNMMKIYYYQRVLIIKYYIKKFTPIILINYYRKIKKNKKNHF